MTAAAPSLDLKSIRIGPLKDESCLKKFSCGERDIDRWVAGKAAKWSGQNRTKVFVAQTTGNNVAKGLYTLSFAQEEASKLAAHRDRDIWNSGVPLIYLGYLAVQSPFQGNGLGKFMLMHCLQRAYLISQHVAFYGVGLRSLNEQTTELYKKFGFGIAENETSTPLMILPIWSIEELITGNKA